MTKNQKIAAGCGALGCLGLIVLALAGGALAYWRYSTQKRYEVYEENRNSNYNFNTNANSNENRESRNSSSSSSSSSSLSDDDKHKLFQAAGMTHDTEFLQKVLKKIGLFKADGTPSDDYAQFVKDHITWGINNVSFIQSINTPEKARAYVDEHLPE